MAKSVVQSLRLSVENASRARRHIQRLLVVHNTKTHLVLASESLVSRSFGRRGLRLEKMLLTNLCRRLRFTSLNQLWLLKLLLWRVILRLVIDRRQQTLRRMLAYDDLLLIASSLHVILAVHVIIKVVFGGLGILRTYRQVLRHYLLHI